MGCVNSKNDINDLHPHLFQSGCDGNQVKYACKYGSALSALFATMGCVTSKKDINDLHPHIFQVENVDELGNTINSGQLEVSDTEIVLYQRDKLPVRWPLKSLRKYGYDKEFFSFEAGRRCPTGSGVYGFSCTRAEKLFNFVQAIANEKKLSAQGEGGDRDTPLSQVEPNYLEPRSDSSTARNDSSRTPRRLSLLNSSRLSSVGSSNGCTSPSTPNFVNDDAFMHPLSEEPEGMPKVLSHPQYENVDLPNLGHQLYENINVSRTSIDLSRKSLDLGLENVLSHGKSVDLSRTSVDEDEDSPHRYYTNLDLKERSKAVLPVLHTPSIRQVDYAELDLDNSQPSYYPPSSPVDGKKPTREGYVTIDFDRTVALSQSASSCLVEGVRKTRHDTTPCSMEAGSVRHSTCLSD